MFSKKANNIIVILVLIIVILIITCTQVIHSNVVSHNRELHKLKGTWICIQSFCKEAALKSFIFNITQVEPTMFGVNLDCYLYVEDEQSKILYNDVAKISGSTSMNQADCFIITINDFPLFDEKIKIELTKDDYLNIHNDSEMLASCMKDNTQLIY